MIKIAPFIVCLLVLLVPGFFTRLQGQEGRPVHRADLPPSVLEESARIEGLGRPRFLERNAQGRRIYVLYSKRTGPDREWYFDPAGGLIGHSRPIPSDSIPSEIFPFIRVILEQRLENPQIRKCRLIQVEKEINFELEVQGKQGRNSFLVRFLFDEKGKLLKESEVGAGRFDRII